MEDEKRIAALMEELEGIKEELRQLQFAEIPHHHNEEIYKGLLKNLEFGLYENEAAFLEAVKKEGLESFAIADGYDFDNPDEEILPQYAEVHKSKTLEESAFEGEKMSHELNGMLVGDRIAGPLGSVIGLGIGSFFGLFAGAAEAATIRRLSRA